MDRRALLASAAGALALGAGCSSLSPSGPESPGDLSVDRADEGVEFDNFEREATTSPTSTSMPRPRDAATRPAPADSRWR